MPPDIAKLAHDILHDPVRIDVSPASIAVDRIEQHVFFVGTAAKRTLLTDLLADPAMDRVLVFTRTKHGADKVCRYLLQAGISTEALHGNKAQNARVRALEAFRAGKARVLVATDIAARGIDVAGISHVINFDPPGDGETYVHRIGRTGRAGAKGIGITLVAPSEHHDVSQLAARLGLEHGLPTTATERRTSPSLATRRGGRSRRGNAHHRAGAQR